MNKQVIQSADAPAAIGPYSQAIRVADTVYLSGQIPLNPKTMQIVEGGIGAQANRVFANLSAVAQAAGATLNDIVKLTILLTDLAEFAKVNEIMAAHFAAPYPARATYQVAALPRGAKIEVEAVLVVPARGDANSQTGWRETFDQTKGQ
ncbi:MAG TPA: RidA family protein [Casimicrobiaceae bacterium]